MSWRQVASTACPKPGVRGRREGVFGAAGATPVRRPSRANSPAAAAGVCVNRSTSISTANVSSTRQSGSTPLASRAAPKDRARPSQLW